MICTKPDIRMNTFLIIRKDGKYLSMMGMLMTSGPVWDQHLSNAWRTRDRELARMEAAKYGGQLVLFNNILWEVKPL